MASTKTIWAGRVISALPVLLMLSGLPALLTHNPQMVDQFTHKFGYSEGALTTVGILELLGIVLYVVPRTAVLGAIVMTGYLGGAIATHVRIGDPGWPVALTAALLAWLGLWLREERLKALLPLRK